MVPMTPSKVPPHGGIALIALNTAHVLCLSKADVLGRFGVVDLSGFKTEILRFRRNPTFQEKSYVSGEVLRFKRNPTFQEKSYVSGEVLCSHPEAGAVLEWQRVRWGLLH
jgi:hypothetical protein